MASVDLDAFQRYRELGLMPVTFGDVVLDRRKKFAICSGDLLMLALAEAFRPRAAVFVADVDGVYTEDPKRAKGARLLPQVRPADVGSIHMGVGGHDVTGGLEGKLRRMLAVSRHAEQCLLVNGLKKGRLLAALRGEDVVGTRVTP